MPAYTKQLAHGHVENGNYGCLTGLVRSQGFIMGWSSDSLCASSRERGRKENKRRIRNLDGDAYVCLAECVYMYMFQLWTKCREMRKLFTPGFVCGGSGQLRCRKSLGCFSATWIEEKTGHDERRCQAAVCRVFSAELDNRAKLAVSLVPRWSCFAMCLHVQNARSLTIMHLDGFSKTFWINFLNSFFTVEISVKENETESVIKASPSCSFKINK